MRLPKWGWITTKLLIILAVPTCLYIWACQSVLTGHLKSIVTNDPEAGLSRSISALKLSLDEEYQILLNQIGHTTDKDWLQKDLTNPRMTLAQYHEMGGEIAGYLQRPLLVLADKNGNVLFDTLSSSNADNLTRTPTLTPEPALLAVKNLPGLAEAYEKNTETGLITYANQYYLSASSPIISKKKMIGAILLGMKLNNEILERIKSITQNEIAFYANNGIQISTFPNSAASEVNKTAFATRHSAITINHQNFLWDDVPIADLDQTVTGHFFIFQPIRESTILNGSIQNPMIQLSVIFVLAMLGLGLWYAIELLSPLRRITQQIELINDGQPNIYLPTQRRGDWGNFARSIHEIIENAKDKERVSLVLGKVLSPQSTQKILAEKNYFSLKGERRECAVLQAQIKGFNIRSQNMEPEVLVEILNSYLTLVQQMVFKQEGMVDKFLVDTAVCVWGAPLADEEKEIRAVRAALEIQTAVKELNLLRSQKDYPSFGFGIGIHTGSVVSGNLGSDQRYDYSVMGKPLQIADKLCSMAALGQVLVSEETYEKIKDLVRATPGSPIALSSGKKSINTYEINGIL